MMPKQSEIEIPLLEVVASLQGGQARPRDIYPLLEKKFPDLTTENLEERLESGTPKWTNRVQWVRQALVAKGEMSSPQRGFWAITEKGRARLSAAGRKGPEDLHVPVSLFALHEEYVLQFKANLLEKLIELTPGQFEHFAKKLMTAYGFVGMTVTNISRDGGIDGDGLLKVGLAHMRVAFQCKRWRQNTVQRPEIDKFRGAIQGRFEQGIFFTTSEFTDGAKAASLQKGAVPIVLLDGESIMDLMIEKQFGVQRQPLELYLDEIDRLFAERE